MAMGRSSSSAEGALAEWAYVEDGTWADAIDRLGNPDITAIAVGPDDEILLLCPNESAVVRLDANAAETGRFHLPHPPGTFVPDGAVLAAVRDEPGSRARFSYAHGLSVSPDGSLLVADNQANVVRRFSADGELLQTIGTVGAASDTGTNGHFHSVVRSAGPFNGPTRAVEDGSGRIFVADGYRNAAIHVFASRGEHISSWGRPGGGPGEFRLPHSIALLSPDSLVVADRENGRLQVFTSAGEFVTSIDGLVRPCDVASDAAGNLYVIELSSHAAGPQLRVDPGGGATSDSGCLVVDQSGRKARVVGAPGGPPLTFGAPHAVAVDSRGTVFVGETPRILVEVGSGLSTRSRTLHALVRIA